MYIFSNESLFETPYTKKSVVISKEDSLFSSAYDKYFERASSRKKKCRSFDLIFDLIAYGEQKRVFDREIFAGCSSVIKKRKRGISFRERTKGLIKSRTKSLSERIKKNGRRGERGERRREEYSRVYFSVILESRTRDAKKNREFIASLRTHTHMNAGGKGGKCRGGN